jgi:hypothetical protein
MNKKQTLDILRDLITSPSTDPVQREYIRYIANSVTDDPEHNLKLINNLKEMLKK